MADQLDGFETQTKIADRSPLDDLLDRWECARADGTMVSPEELCRNCPELLESLREQIRALEELGALGARIGTRPSGEDTAEPQPEAAPSASRLYVGVDYADLRYHDGGGLGVVYRARDEQMHRDVAVKFLREQFTDDPQSQERFLVEAEITARLDHPGVIPVHGRGKTDDGRPFYVMQFVHGQKLSQTIKEYHADRAARSTSKGALEFRDLLARFVSVCRTVAYAHSRGIVHRDIKPGNIIKGRYGETLVADWGLYLTTPRQRPPDPERDPGTLVPGSGTGQSTPTGGGTPAYMSPEQHADTPEISLATDIYSLGATLYHLLTGGPPVDLDQPFHQIRMQVISGRIRPARQANPDVPAALEAVCRKAMAVDPAERYMTALDLAADVERYLGDEPVTVYDEPRSESLARWVRRHRREAQIGIASLLAVVLIAFGAAAWLGRMAHRESRARQAAQSLTAEVARSNARLAALSMAKDINQRLGVLAEDAADPGLREALATYNLAERDSPRRRSSEETLQSWLAERAKDRDSLAGKGPVRGKRQAWAANWFLTDARGTQVARAPYHVDGKKARSLGKNFAFRSYFTGEPYDLPEGAAAEPLRQPAHIAAGHKSKADGRYKATFSVPVRDLHDGSTIGVLGFSVYLGDFAAIDVKNLSLIQVKEDTLEGAPRRGLVLHHPDLDERLEASPFPRIPARLVDRLRQPVGDVVYGFEDPLNPEYGNELLAAFEPVLVDGKWPATVRTPGWVVVVVARAGSDE